MVGCYVRVARYLFISVLLFFGFVFYVLCQLEHELFYVCATWRENRWIEPTASLPLCVLFRCDSWTIFLPEFLDLRKRKEEERTRNVD
mmetsp:Transcript_43430/g.85706  ORF Transcript_43430/g.85706 Transcript_43430/m.85706 type:complete len:88 (-) Transcript_43430:606-869(-)